MRLRYKIGLIIVVLSIAICFMTYQSYALWIKDMVANQDNVVEVGCFSVEYKEVQDTQINLQNTYPVSDSKGLSGTPYTFTITNTCTIADSYIVTLNTKKSNQIKAGTVEIGKDNKGNSLTESFEAYNMKDKIKYAISFVNNEETEDSNKPSSGTNLGEFSRMEGHINEDKSELTSVDDLDESIIIGSGTLTENQSSTYHLYLWFDAETAGNEIMNQKFEASINVISRATMPDNIEFAGIHLPVVKTGNGLYIVDHSNSGVSSIEDLLPVASYTADSENTGWQMTEYRFAGKAYTEGSTDYVHNYVTFNGELWRIIGLVNVLVPKEDGSREVEQRLKIMRNETIGKYSWDDDSNDWTQSTLMTYLNGDYYNGVGEKSLTDEVSKEMIDEDIIWNIGGSSHNSSTVYKYYDYERGTSSYNHQPTEWKKEDGNIFHSIGLIYPSDYGFAASGGTTERELCLNAPFNDWDAELNTVECLSTTWLDNNHIWIWTMTPRSDAANRVFQMNVDQPLGFQDVDRKYDVFPVVYIKKNVRITGGSGEHDHPYVLELKAVDSEGM